MPDNRLRILNVEPLGYSSQARRVVQELGELVESPLGRSELLEHIGSFHVLIVRLGHQIDRELLDAASRLQAVVTATTGLDHIDVDCATKKGIAVLSLRGETEFLRTVRATSEHTWALLLALVRRLPAAFQSVKNGEWSRDRFRGHELSGKRLGLVGFGRVARHVAQYGRAFNMHVAAFDPYASAWEDDVDRVPQLAQLLGDSDVVSLHVPLNPETQQMIRAEAMALMRPDAVLINTSRGEIVCEQALVDVLESRRLAGAALDVLCRERDDISRRQNRLLQYARTHENLIITPHIAGATCESMANTEVFMAHKLTNFWESR